MTTKKLKFMMVALGVLLSVNANAKVEVDGIYYNLDKDEKQAEVTYGNSKYTDKVVIPESFSYDEVIYSVTSIGWDAFRNCSDLTSVTIPNSVTSIGRGAFRNCRDLTSVTIPNSVTSIGEYSFYGCSGLTSLSIPNSVMSIGYFAFIDCNDLISVYITDLAAWCNISFDGDGSNPLYHANIFLNGEEVTDLVIPNGVTSIGGRAFRNCRGLTSVTIPNSVTSIGESAFKDCI
ncbi:MAG: leucine-rich repeat domain-containing protein [Bacteroidaceae bacterium]|nr:leucine-rich repeat domain-containing protein [Bacteroidaceae bacterium]